MVCVGVAARLLAPLANGVESSEMLGVGVTSPSSLSGESRIVRSSQEACGAERRTGLPLPSGGERPTRSVVSPL